MVFAMPPTALSRSRTVTGWPRADNRQAAAIPAGPAPKMTMRSDDTLQALGNDEVVEVHGKWQTPERQRERFANPESFTQPAVHLPGRGKRQVIRISNRKLAKQQPAGAHRGVIGNHHDRPSAGFQHTPR